MGHQLVPHSINPYLAITAVNVMCTYVSKTKPLKRVSSGSDERKEVFHIFYYSINYSDFVTEH